jgi:hypothetical protein
MACCTAEAAASTVKVIITSLLVSFNPFSEKIGGWPAGFAL